MMDEQNGTPQKERTAAVLSVLELFSISAAQPFDRLLASRLVGEAARAIPGDDALAWARRLVEVGESLDLRIRSIECELNDVLVFLGQKIPVAMCRTDQEGRPQWLLIAESRGNKVRLVGAEDIKQERWVTHRVLMQMLGTSNESAQVRWVGGQPAMACEGASKRADDHGHGHGHGHGHDHDDHPSPLKRLIGLIQPERSDLWAILIFSMIVGILALASPIAIEALVNTVAFGQYFQPVIVLAFMLFIFLGFAAAIRGLITYIAEIVQRRLFIRVVEDLAYRLPRVQQSAWDGHYGPELANRFFDVVTLQKIAASLLLDGIAIVLQTVIGMAVLAFYHPFLLGFDAVLLFLIVFVIFVLGRGAVKTAIKESKVKYSIAAWLEELARNPTAFKMHGGPQLALDRADTLAVEYLAARKKHFRVVFRQILFAFGLQAVAATVLLGLGGWLVIAGQLTLGQLVAAELIVMMIVGSFAKLGKHMESFYDLLASVDKLGVLFDLPVESHNKLFYLPDDRPAKITMDHATYRYPAGLAVSGLSLEIEPGERIALVGADGSGKSTVIELLSGLRHPQSGHVEVDGIDAREIRPDSLREQLALARDIEIFPGTIAENVHLHRPQINARDIRDALEAVGLLESLLCMPDGLNTKLQSDGKPLSTSQARRLMLARAIAGRPRLLLIDGTLDGLSSSAMRDVLDGILQGAERQMTVVIATTQQAVIDRCDRVVQLGHQSDFSSENTEIETH
jgi:ABC-type bacteriocin/lantibiotic exporter with double-glycine peptidase domain